MEGVQRLHSQTFERGSLRFDWATQRWTRINQRGRLVVAEGQRVFDHCWGIIIGLNWKYNGRWFAAHQDALALMKLAESQYNPALIQQHVKTMNAGT